MLMRGNTTGALADLQAEGRSEWCPLPNQKQARFLDTDTVTDICDGIACDFLIYWYDPTSTARCAR